MRPIICGKPVRSVALPRQRGAGAISRHHDDWKRRLHGRPLFALSTRLDNRFSVVFDQGAVVYVGGLENRLLGFGQF